MVLRIVKLLISAAYALAVQPLYRYLSRHRDRSCILLYYHAVPPGTEAGLARQLDYLVKATTPVPLGFGGPFVPKVRYAIVTIDDAFRSAVERAVPELLKRRIPFAVFVPAGGLGRPPGWLEDPGRREASDSVATAEALRAIPPESVVFGSHTISHPHLPRLAGDEARREILGSRRQLEALLGREVLYLSFPFGDFSPRDLDLCREAGYRQVLTSGYEPAFSPPDRFARGRIGVNPSDWMIEFKLKAAGDYAWMAPVSALKKSFKNVLAFH